MCSLSAVYNRKALLWHTAAWDMVEVGRKRVEAEAQETECGDHDLTDPEDRILFRAVT